MILQCPSFTVEKKNFHPLICSSSFYQCSFFGPCHVLQVVEDFIERTAKIPLKKQVGK